MSDPAALAEPQPVVAPSSSLSSTEAQATTTAQTTNGIGADVSETAFEPAKSVASPALAQTSPSSSPSISFTFGIKPQPITPPRPVSVPAVQNIDAENAAVPTFKEQRQTESSAAAASPSVPVSSPPTSPTKSMESEEEGAIDEDEMTSSTHLAGQRSNAFNDRAREHRTPGWGRQLRDDHAVPSFGYSGTSRHDRFSAALGPRTRESGGREPYGRAASLSLSLGASSAGVRGGFGGALEERGGRGAGGVRGMDRRSPEERREHERRQALLHSPPVSGAPISGPNATPVSSTGAPVMRTWGPQSGAASGPSSPVTPWRVHRLNERSRETRDRQGLIDRSESESRRIRAPSVSISEGARRSYSSSQPSPVLSLEERFDGPRPSFSHARRSPELLRRSISRDSSPRRSIGAASAGRHPRGFAPPPRDSGYASRNRRTGSEGRDASEREALRKPIRASSETAELRAPSPAEIMPVCVKMEEDREPLGPRTPPRPHGAQSTSPAMREELERQAAVPMTPPRLAPIETAAPAVSLPLVSNPVAATDVGALAEYAKQDGAERARVDAQIASDEAAVAVLEVKMEVDEAPSPLVQLERQTQPMDGAESTAPPPPIVRPSLAAQIHTADPSSPDVEPSRDVIAEEARMQIEEPPPSLAAPAMMSSNAEVPVASIPAIGAPEPTPDASLVHLDIVKHDIATSELLDANGIPLLTPGSQRLREDIARETRLRLFQRFKPDEVEVQRTLRDNKKLSMQTTLSVMQSAIHGPPLLLEGDLWIDEDAQETQLLRAHLMSKELERKHKLDSKVEALRKQYKTLDAEWQSHCARLDRIAELREQARRPAASTPAGALSTAPAADEHSGGLLASVGMTRGNRRNQTGFAGFGDAVRSEAEFLAILASLETADMQDPNMRAARTTAVAPDMFINATGEGPTLSDFDDDNGFVSDPVQFYLSDFDPDFWSEEEKSIFDRRYTLFPKQFGKIAASLPDKTATQCVRYYYLTKKLEGHDYKAMTAARNRERKRKTRGKPKKAKGSALMADLKIAQEDDDGEEDGISPSDPSSSGKKPRARMLTGLDPSLATVEEEDGSNPRKRRAMMNSAMHPDDDSPSADGEEKRAKKGNKRVKSAKSSKSALAAEGGGGDILSTPPGDSDMAAVEALGALAGLYPGSSAVQEGKAAKKRKSKSSTSNTAPGTPGSGGPGTPTELSGFPGDDAKRRPATSSYWSIAERNEFLRSVAVYGKEWEIVAGKLNNKSAAQARNYFQRNALDVDFAEAAVLGDENANLSLEDRETAADALALNRKASEVGSDTAPRTGYFAGPGGMSLDSPGETPRGLRINSLLNDDAPAEPKRRSAVPDWFNAEGPRRASTAGPGDAGDDTDEDDTTVGRGHSISRPSTAGPPGGNVAHYERAYQQSHHLSAAQHVRPPLSSSQQQHMPHQQQRPHYLAPRPDAYQNSQSASPMGSARMGSMPPPSAFGSASSSRFHSTTYPESFRYSVAPAPAATSEYRSTTPSNTAPGTQVARPDLSQHSRTYERSMSASYSAHSLSPEQRSNSAGWLGKAKPPVAQHFPNSPSTQHTSQVPAARNASWPNPGYSASTASHFNQPAASGRVSPYAHSAGSSPRHSITQQQANSERNSVGYLPPPSSFAAGINRPTSPHGLGSPAHSPYMRPTSAHGSVPQLPQLTRHSSPSPQQQHQHQHSVSGYGHPQQSHQHYSQQQQQQKQHGQAVNGRNSLLPPPPTWPQR